MELTPEEEGVSPTREAARCCAVGIPIGHGPCIVRGNILLRLNQLHSGPVPQVSLSACKKGEAGDKGELHFRWAWLGFGGLAEGNY